MNQTDTKTSTAWRRFFAHARYFAGFLIVCSFTCYLSLYNIKNIEEENIEQTLNTMTSVAKDGLHIWFTQQFKNAELLSSHQEVTSDVTTLLEAYQKGERLLSHPAQERLNRTLAPWVLEKQAKYFFHFCT